MTAANQQPDGSRTYIWGSVTSVMFNIDRKKRDGGSYKATVLYYMDNQGQAKDQAWASQIIDDARNAELRQVLVDLYSKPGQPITLHKVKQGGYWNVERIDLGHTQGQKSQPGPVGMPSGPPGAPPGYAGPAGAPPGYVPPPQPAPTVPTGGVPQYAMPQQENRDGKMRTKEQCIRGEAVQAAATAEIALVHHRGTEYKFDLKRLIGNAEVIARYIAEGVQAPVAAPQAQGPAPVVGAPQAPPPPQPQPAPATPPPPPNYAQAPPPPPAAAPGMAPPPMPQAPVYAAPQAPVGAPPAPQPAPPQVAYAAAPQQAPGQPQPQAAPAAFDDGFGGP